MRSPLLDIEYNRKMLSEILRSIKTRKGEVNTYLDLGSGDGTLTSFVASILKPRRVICVDIEDEALKRCHVKGYGVIKIDLNVEKIPLQDNSIDVSTAFELIEHLWNKDNLLEEVYRVLKPEGVFILTTPNLAAWASRLLLLLGKPPFYYAVSHKYTIHRPGYGHISLYTLDLLTMHLKAVGFKVIKGYGLLTPLYKHNKLSEIISLLFSKIRPSLAPDILVVALKENP